MRRVLLTLLTFLALLPVTALAGFPFEATLDEMAVGADHILVGRVTGVDMIDGAGKPITDPKARTGPGLRNQIRLRVTVDQVLVSNAQPVPKQLFVPLASHLHYALGQIQEAHAQDSEQRLVFLKGPGFDGIKPGVFMRPMEDKPEALRLRQAARRMHD
ncbi:hypothetical protein [Pseudoxanthomonas sp. PXM02]|uniref:hypothetical protein n=1 Tax=Pseudoxanthomonas sp. PXM02 TaxID=2769294 RepID=UPI00177BB09C|nr:hypothetical protein [Pseudoxanthomonas sp. PXM02]MBD9477974.1 hypothetical protein [Pseudoxanthomonas sp. PXM02]